MSWVSAPQPAYTLPMLQDGLSSTTRNFFKPSLGQFSNQSNVFRSLNGAATLKSNFTSFLPNPKGIQGPSHFKTYTIANMFPYEQFIPVLGALGSTPTLALPLGLQNIAHNDLASPVNHSFTNAWGRLFSTPANAYPSEYPF